MGTIKEYGIPNFGLFSISHVEERIKIKNGHDIEPGYYGIEGIITTTKRCETPKEAEEALKEAIFQKIGKETEKLFQRKIVLESLTKDISLRGILQYCTD